MKKRSAYRPRPVHLNAVQRAMQRAATLSAEDQRNLWQIVEASRAAFLRQDEPRDQWKNMADVFNVAERLAALGICSDEASRGAIESAQDVLSRVWLEVGQGGSWTLRPTEVQALDAGLQIHRLQLRFCSLGEYERATAQVRERVEQYRNGNAPKGAHMLGV